jgi:hypothetical protein
MTLRFAYVDSYHPHGRLRLHIVSDRRDAGGNARALCVNRGRLGIAFEHPPRADLARLCQACARLLVLSRRSYAGGTHEKPEDQAE